jgi:hypothetical protein
MEVVMQTLPAPLRYREFRDTQTAWPMDARAALFVLEANASNENYFDRRDVERAICHVEATGCFADDTAQLASFLLYLRDIDPLHAGFVTSSPLPLNSQVQVNFSIDERPIQAVGTIQRCRPFMEGWYEGVVHLHEQIAL